MNNDQLETSIKEVRKIFELIVVKQKAERKKQEVNNVSQQEGKM